MMKGSKRYLLFVLVIVVATGCSGLGGEAAGDRERVVLVEEEALVAEFDEFAQLPWSKDMIPHIDWALTGTFTSNGYEMRGHEGQVGFLDVG
ncbi:hypothetical protein [Paenibacillus sp. 7541]|uniref:hypothetical protein n=1 Tax=Paenibacillus TaxID=44249 RepID=UPI001140EF31|nr:hypothetical protein [Paenibacillus sp. 7541]